MSLVLDGSVALAWVLEEEPRGMVASIVGRIAEAGAFVPSLWRLEVANGLQIGVRRRRVTAEHRDASLADLRRWNIEIDDETDRHAWSSTLRLAERHGLTLYDAAYLELAERRRLPLATLDAELVKAATAIGVALCA